MLGAAADLGATIWLALTIPVLIAGLVRVCREKPRRAIRMAAWTGAWIAGVARMFVAVWWSQKFPRATYTCGHSASASWCSLNEFGPAVVQWGELPLCAAFLALGVFVTWTLARPAQPLR